jgi:adenosylhomocysteine nucleosidase
MKQSNLFTHLRSVDDSYIVVTALQHELPDALPEKILFTGVGKINATHVLTRYLERNPHIKTVINYGTAGGVFGVKQGDVVRCTSFVQGDMDCGELVGGAGITYGDDNIVKGVLSFPGGSQYEETIGYVCRTQDRFVDDVDALDLLEYTMQGKNFNCVDMEAYALAKVCAMMERDFICYKYISDDANSNADDEWTTNVANGEPAFYNLLQEHHGYKMIE